MAIFASGSGSNAEALIKKSRVLTQLEVAFVLTDNPKAKVIERCLKHQVKSLVIENKKNKAEFERSVLNALVEHQVEWIFLAGFMKILSPDFLREFEKVTGSKNRVINIHPSKLPEYQGKDALLRAYKEKANPVGVTVHFVDEGVDTGPHIIQELIHWDTEMSFEELAQVVHLVEHKLYTQVLEKISQGELHDL